MVDEKIIESFHRMWDTFPERARLIHRDRTVLAVNRRAAEMGMKVGARCIDDPPLEAHRGCMAAAALKEGEGRYGLNPQGTRIRFWIPVDGCKDVYVHFSIPTDHL